MSLFISFSLTLYKFPCKINLFMSMMVFRFRSLLVCWGEECHNSDSLTDLAKQN